MNPLEEFAAFEGKQYATSTRRLYLCAARKAFQIAGKAPEKCGSYDEVRTLLNESLAQNKFPKKLRIAPLLRFLDSKIPQNPAEIPDYGPLRSWVIDRIGKETVATKEAVHFIRRDLAMLACLCVAPEKGSPRRWPKAALKVVRKGGGFEVKMWEKPVETPSLALALLYWNSWRDRLDRPEQSRLHRKAWAYSDLLFPNSKGEVLTKHAMRNALLRLGLPESGPHPTPERVRQAFLQIKA